MEPNDTGQTHEHATVSMKVVLLIFAVVLIGALGYFVYQQYYAPDAVTDNGGFTSTTPSSGGTTSTAVDCDFAGTTASLKPGVTYDLGGTEEFDTLVCGYLTQKEENMAFEGNEPLIKNRAYLTITEFHEVKFKEALDKQISEGNTVNSSSGGTYQLGCGCYEGGKLISDTGDLTDATSLTRLLASTATKPVMVKLGFQIHGGRGCTCCNLVDKLEVI